MDDEEYENETHNLDNLNGSKELKPQDKVSNWLTSQFVDPKEIDMNESNVTETQIEEEAEITFNKPSSPKKPRRIKGF
jgi:hypothetical protein